MGVDVFQLFLPEDVCGDDQSNLTTALLQLRQDIKADMGSFVETYINDKFSKFLQSVLSER